MNVVAKFWWTQITGEVIGIVVVRPEVGPKKAYMGVCKSLDEATDTKYLSEYGTPLYAKQFEEVLDTLKERKGGK